MNLRVLRLVAALGLPLIGVGVSGPVSAAPTTTETFMMILPDFRTVTSPGELNPEALARVELHESTGEVCLTMRTVEVEPPITVHLHQGGEDGPILATFFDQTTDLNPQGCATVGADVVRDIQDNGFGYTLDIHSAGIPGDGRISGPLAASSLDAFLTPEAVTSGPGDPDGTGIISLFVFDRSGEIFFFVNTEGLTSPLTVELHKVARGDTDGPVVATLAEGATHDDPAGNFFIERSLARDLNRNPSSYYILVRSADFPAGALRGQLER